ncbi:kinesin-like protein KIF20A isoform X2 [Nelusetta ayraudi]|uniref:kinesin-like protein KIF20A isoform X2 n=1 Tax=Nelusetta ayraudi TaxID=303726 RepID=UPI003F71C88B
MALALSSPSGYPYDEDEEIAVLESTAAEYRGPSRPRLPEISVISPGLDSQLSITEPKVGVQPLVSRGNADEGNAERMNVFLRIRPLTDAERNKGEEQGCVSVQNEETLLLKAPKESQNMKTAERGITQSMHKFSFTKIFPPETTQQQFYDSTMRKMVKDVLHGENRLLYTYGVTNSGKTYTIQGSGREAGLLPRALSSLFKKVQGRLYDAMDLKPVMYQDVRHLSKGEVKVEEFRKNSLLKEDESLNCRRGGNTSVWDSGIGGLSSTSHMVTQLEDSESVCLEPDSLSHSGGDDLPEGMQYSIWVSFYEIYNEFLYDLLDAPHSLSLKKRVTLRLSDDRHGNPYVKDLMWIQVRSAEEAWRLLRAGQRNQSFASTHLNQNSSRSHSIFSVRILHVHPEMLSSSARHISELTVCDLAGSERCREQVNGERMKEATNINTSLLTLGRCITILRHNQSNKSRPAQVVPFRDSKLTRVLQGFFCGRGASCMVVNINPCVSIYDETLQALKFSAIATQLVHGPSTKTRVAYILSLLRQPAGNGNESTLLEEEEEENSDVEDGDITMLDTEALLQAIDVLKKEVQRQREEKEVLEANVREQVVSEMMEVINEMQNGFRENLETQEDLLEKRYEDKINNIQNSLKTFYTEELKERDQDIEALSAALEKRKEADQAVVPVPPVDVEGPRRSQRLMTQADQSRLQAELDQCRAELSARMQELRKLKMQLEVPGSTGSLTCTADRKLEEGQRNLRQLRVDLQKLGAELQSGERACCRNTGGERLRQAITSSDDMLAKQRAFKMKSRVLTTTACRDRTDACSSLTFLSFTPSSNLPITITATSLASSNPVD